MPKLGARDRVTGVQCNKLHISGRLKTRRRLRWSGSVAATRKRRLLILPSRKTP